MKKIISGILILFLTATVGYCQESKQPLQLTIKSDKQVYGVGEDIKLTATLTNNSDKELIVFWSKEKALFISDKSTVQTVIFPERSAKGYENLYVKPKGSVINNVLVGNDLKPIKSKYKLTLKYEYPKSIVLDFKTLPNQRIWTGVTLSNTITIEVVDKMFSLKIVEYEHEGQKKTIVDLDDHSQGTQKFLSELWLLNRPLFEDDHMNNFGPDSGYQEIAFINGTQKLIVRSWHRLFERDPNLVVTSQGIIKLDGKNRTESLSQDQKWYLDFRRGFDAIFDGAIEFSAHVSQNNELLSFQGQEFYRQAQQFASACLWQECSGRLSEFWRLLNQLEQQTDKDKSIDSLLATQYLASAILKYGGNEDYQKLLSLYDNVPLESLRQAPLLEALSSFWIKQELAKVFSEKKPDEIKFTKEDFKLPPQLASSSDELKNAWMLYKRVITTYEKQLEGYKDKGWIYTQNSWPLFYGVIADFLHDKKENTIGKMTQFEWGGWCGTGSVMLLIPKSRTIWMASLKERNYPLALGALLAYMNQGTRMMLNENENFLWQKQFIEWVGFDWETILIGAVLDGHAEYLRFLGTYGSKRTAQYLSQMETLPMDGWTRETYLRSVAAFITPGCLVGNYGTGSSADITRQAKDEISQETQKQLLDILTSQVNPNIDSRMMDTVSHLLTPLCRPEAKDALRKILQSPYVEPRKRAAITLEALGEKVKIPADPGPVHFRLLVNDAPLANKDVEWTLKQDNQQVSSSVHTDENGQFSLQSDYLVDPNKNWKLMVSSGRNIKNIDDVFFNFETDLPKNPDKPIDIPIKTSILILNLHFNYPGDYYKDKQMGVRLNYVGPSGGGLVYFQAVGEEFKLPVSSKITFSHLALGEYYITIFVPGSAMWAQQNIKLGEEPQELKVDLQPGADLKFDILAPGGTQRDQNVSFNLLTKEGRTPGSNFWPVNYDYMTKSYRGLPLGEYEFSILSSGEKKKQRRQRNRMENREEIFPGMLEYQGEKRTIIINDKSPDVIDLGTIELRPIQQAKSSIGRS